MRDKYVLEVVISKALEELRLNHPDGATEEGCKLVVQHVLDLDKTLFSLIARLIKRVESLEEKDVEEKALDKPKQSS